MSMNEILILCGVPSSVFGLVIWYFKKKFDESEAKREEKEKNIEDLILLMLQATRANTILCTATAEAVRDGKCNGNMAAALEAVDKTAKEEKQFLLDKSIKYMFN